MFSRVKNFFVSFLISFAIFGIVALLVVDLVIKSLGGAFTIGNLGFGDTPEAPEIHTPVTSSSGGNSLYILAVITDYRPSYYGDYDFKYIKNNIGLIGGATIPGDVRPATDSIFNLPMIPTVGSIDTSGGQVNIIGGLKESTERIIHNDITVLIRMDKERKQFTFTYFPKNSVITYGGEKVLFRDLYYNYGAEALVNVVHSITGIRPDRHIILHSEYVDDVIDSLGGIDLTLSVPMKLNDPANGIALDLKQGYNLIDGDTAQQYLIYDNYSEADSFSLERAGLVMVRAILARLTQPAGYATAGDAFTKLRQYCVTDMLVSDVTDNKDVWYAYSTYGKQQIDINGRYSTEDGQQVYIIDNDRTLSTFLNYRKIYE